MKRALVYMALFVLSASLAAPAQSSAASSNATYYAVYCSKQGSDISLQSGHNAALACSNSANPGIETSVNSLSTNPKGTHDVTIVEADCYPDNPKISPSDSIDAGHISCSNGPDATLTLGSHFAASKKAPAPKGGSKKKAGKPTPKAPAPSAQTGIQSGGLPKVDASTTTIKDIIQVFFGIIGAFALLSMTASGLKYITSGGDPQKTSEAKKGIIYAVVGLALAISAEAIVAFVINWGAPT